MNNIQPRYKAFLDLGGGKNYEFMFFISRMKHLYMKNEGININNPIRDHDRFTLFIELLVNKLKMQGVTSKEFTGMNEKELEELDCE